MNERELRLEYRDYVRFNRLLLDRCGMYFSESRQSELALGVKQAFAASTCVNLDAYYTLLLDPKGGAMEMDRLINAVTVGETHFFRNQPQFDALYHHVLPAIIARQRSLRALRIWSAGCASGEEAYSVAMLLRELLPDANDWAITILATDINNEALDRARQAVYGEWAFREERARLWRQRYFIPEGKRYRLKPEVCRMVTFARLNLVEDVYPSYETNTTTLDLILCRNVTIYFSETVTRRVVARFYEALSPGGWLVVGHAEPSLSVYQRYETCNYPDTVLYRRPCQSTLGGVERGGASARSARPPAVEPPALPEDTPPSYPPPAPAVETPGDLLEQAEEWIHDGRAEEARDLLLTLSASRPGDALVGVLLGRAYANLGDWRNAEYWCAHAVHLDKLAGDAYYTLSLVYQHQGRLDEAITMMKKVVYLDRNHILGHFGLADLYRDKRLWGQAQKSLDNARRLLNGHADDDLIPGSGGITVSSLRETIFRQQQRWGLETSEQRYIQEEYSGNGRTTRN
ncbi:MAG TPA: CheR family methyltransferase [Anaerolineae bacterium]|nr:CheR family methyltransferase [Anaerolineae bacterium]